MADISSVVFPVYYHVGCAGCPSRKSKKFLLYVDRIIPKGKTEAQMVHAFNRDDTSVSAFALKAGKGNRPENLTAADIVIHPRSLVECLAVQNQATDHCPPASVSRTLSVSTLYRKTP